MEDVLADADADGGEGSASASRGWSSWLLPLFRTALVERSAYREMFLNGQPPTVSEREKGAGPEVTNLLAEIRAIVDETNGNSTIRKAG